MCLVLFLRWFTIQPALRFPLIHGSNPSTPLPMSEGWQTRCSWKAACSWASLSETSHLEETHKFLSTLHFFRQSCHLCGQWIRLTLTQKKTSCGWLSDILGLLLCSSCFQTFLSEKYVGFKVDERLSWQPHERQSLHPWRNSNTDMREESPQTPPFAVAGACG